MVCLRGISATILIGLVASKGVYENPVLRGDVPDPGVVFDSKLGLWVVATTGCDDKGCFSLHTSPDLVEWTANGYIFPLNNLPVWASQGNTYWAPEIHMMPSGGFVAYFVGRNGLVDKQNGPLCVGAAMSVGGGALGPFKDIGAPLVTAPKGSCFGVIDPTYFDQHIIVKTDGNSCGKPTTIFSIPLTPDGLNLTEGGAWVPLITNDAPWEGPLVEAPWIVRNESYLYLFFSGSVYDKPSYAIGVARANKLEGPWEKFPGNPILHSAPEAGQPGSQLLYGPGHCSVISLPAGSNPALSMAMIYAAEVPGGGPRNLLLDALVWSSDGWPGISGNVPSNSSQPIP